MAFSPQNPLEVSLVRAATDAAHRARFYNDFLDSRVMLVARPPPGLQGRGEWSLEEGDAVDLECVEIEARVCVAAYSSAARLPDPLPAGRSPVRVPVSDLLRMLRGDGLFLNPGSDYGKVFTPQEISELLDGSFWRPSEQIAEGGAGGRVLISEPVRTPDRLIHALVQYFRSEPRVLRAWCALAQREQVDSVPHTLVAIEMVGTLSELWARLGPAIGAETPDPPLDVKLMTGQGEVDEYIRANIKPFFEREGVVKLGPRLQEFRSNDIRFLGEQSGEVERRFLGAITPLLAERFERGYLARVAYGQDPKEHVALCVFGGTLDGSFADSIAALCEQIFGSAAHLDITRITEAQERQLAQVCSAFHGAPAAHPEGLRGWVRWMWTGK